MNLRNLLQPALQALRLYWRAVLIFQLLAIATAVSYYFFPTVQMIASTALAWKISGGICFVIGTNILSGGVIPEILKTRMRPPDRKAPAWGDLLHFFILLAILAICIDYFYRLQEIIFGNGTEWWRVGIKIIFDQSVYTLCFVMPFILLWFMWRENHYSLSKTFRNLPPDFLKKRVLSLFIPNCLFWTPALAAVYALPTELQFLLYLFLNAAWCTLMVFIARDASRDIDSVS